MAENRAALSNAIFQNLWTRSTISIRRILKYEIFLLIEDDVTLLINSRMIRQLGTDHTNLLDCFKTAAAVAEGTRAHAPAEGMSLPYCRRLHCDQG